MRLAISGAEFDDDGGFDSLVETAHGTSCELVELWHPQHTAKGVDELRRSLQDASLEAVCVSSPTELWHPERRREMQELLLEAIRVAGELGAAVANTYFGFGHERDDGRAIDEYAAALRPCLDAASECDVTIVLENEFNVFGSDPDRSDVTRRPGALSELFRKVDSPHFKANFDACNFLFAGVVPFPDAYATVGESIAYVHVKDGRAHHGEAPPSGWLTFEDYGLTYRTCPLGDGDVDWDALLRRLCDDGYGGILCLEPHAAPDEIPEAMVQAAAYVRERIG
jgi:sugar phosphate isomerase/epimerase